MQNKMSRRYSIMINKKVGYEESSVTDYWRSARAQTLRSRGAPQRSPLS